MSRLSPSFASFAPLPLAPVPLTPPHPDPRTLRRLEALKTEIIREIDGRARFTQQVVDQIFSFGELGFQETETSRFLTHMLRDSGFTVEEGVAGIPTAWVASWGTGKPVI